MIEQRCEREGLAIKSWETTDDGETAVLGRFVVATGEYDDDGLYEGDEGVLTACVVGAEQYGNQRVLFSFTADGYDGGNDVRDLSALEPADS